MHKHVHESKHLKWYLRAQTYWHQLTRNYAGLLILVIKGNNWTMAVPYKALFLDLLWVVVSTTHVSVPLSRKVLERHAVHITEPEKPGLLQYCDKWFFCPIRVATVFHMVTVSYTIFGASWSSWSWLSPLCISKQSSSLTAVQQRI